MDLTIELLATYSKTTDVNINAKNNKGETALDLAIRKKSSYTSRLLCVYGAVTNTETLPRQMKSFHPNPNYDKYLEISYNILSKNLPAVQRILSTLPRYDQNEVLNYANCLGDTSLHEVQDLEIAKYILENYDVNVNAKNNTGETPLDLAIERGYIEIAQLLRTHGATCSTKNIDRLNELTQVAPLANASVTKESSTTLNSLFSAILKKFFAHPMDQNDM